MRREQTMKTTTILAMLVLLASSFALGSAAASKTTHQVAILHKDGLEPGTTLKSVPCTALERHLAHANWEEERTIALALSECQEAGAL
jgi:hypothetical protein